MDKETVDLARKESEEAYLIYANLKATYLSAEQDWLKKSRRFKDFDYQLALVDGRLKKIPSGGEHKEKKQPELTLEQLKSVIAKLGVNLVIEEPQEIIEEVLEITEELPPEVLGDVLEV
jgi:hypothetical protein